MLLHCFIRPIIVYTSAGAVGTTGVLSWQYGFLIPANQINGFIPVDDNTPVFWYKATLLKYREKSTFKGLFEDDSNENRGDWEYTTALENFCKRNENTLNLLSNAQQIQRIRKWCTLDEEGFTIPQHVLQIFNWEYYNRCRVVWLHDKEKSSYGWYLPFILSKSGYYFGGEEVNQLLLSFSLFFDKDKENRNSKCPGGDQASEVSSTVSTQKILPYWWNRKKREFEYVEDATDEDGFKASKFKIWI